MCHVGTVTVRPAAAILVWRTRRSELSGDSPVNISPTTDIGTSTLGHLRRGLLGVVLFGAIGLGAELVLQEHFDGWTQRVPLVLLAVVALQSIVLFRYVTPRTLLVFRFVSVVCLAAGMLGAILHYRGNVEFELERTPTLAGIALFRAALEGATPTLAPGALLQLGLIGLLFTWRHPSLERRRRQ